MLLWGIVSSALLFLGFAVLVLCMYLAGSAGAAPDLRTEANRLMVGIYFRVVFFKGLLPQLWLALAAWPLLRRAWPDLERGGMRRLAGLGVAALLAYALVAPLLLSADWPGWPALQMRNSSHQIGTALGCVVGVVLAAGAGARLSGARVRPLETSLPPSRSEAS